MATIEKVDVNITSKQLITMLSSSNTSGIVFATTDNKLVLVSASKTRPKIVTLNDLIKMK